MRVFIIGEAGVNHNGDIDLAKKLIDVAVDAGVDAVKFQTWKTELLVSKEAKQAEYQIENTQKKESQYEMLKSLELSYKDFSELKEYCDTKDVLFLSTPDEEQSADFLNSMQDIFKVGSGELTNIPFLKHIARFGKKIILSTGMATLAEIEKALNVIYNEGVKREDVTVLHVTTQYPTPMIDVNLKAMITIKDAFKVNIGYSDHTMGIEVPIAAVALGAQMIEKHFTLSREMEGPDHKASLEPQELKLMVNSIRNIEKALGDGIKKPQDCEIENKKVVRKTIVARKKIMMGEEFSEHNLKTMRVGSGISSSLWNDIIGVKASRIFVENETISF